MPQGVRGMTEQHAEFPQELAIGLAIVMIIAILGTIALAIHIQIPDQQYCNTVLENRHNEPMGSVWYIESLHPYDYSLNQSRCIYNKDGAFVANPEFSIWGIRV
jgi:hypothetical protein